MHHEGTRAPKPSPDFKARAQPGNPRGRAKKCLQGLSPPSRCVLSIATATHRPACVPTWCVCASQGGAGTFTIPGLIKIKTVKKAARPAKKNVPNPFKPGELMDVKAKPESIAVKCLALKKLKDMA